MLQTKDDQDDLTEAMQSAFTNQDQVDEAEAQAEENV